jgi:SAM-dependent methyltransferase
MNSRLIENTLQTLEREREERWRRGSQSVQLKLHWRAQAVRHFFHVLPGETILEWGGGSGLLTEQLQQVFRGENPITSIVFSDDLLEEARARRINGATFLRVSNLRSDLPPGQFDYVIGSGMLWHQWLTDCLSLIHRVLKPGGQILFFEPNLRFPARTFHQIRSRRGIAESVSIPADRVIQTCSHQEFTHIDLTPYDIVSTHLGRRLMQVLQAKAVLLEHMPGVRLACASMCFTARKPGVRLRPAANLATRPELQGAVSVVLPAHNEAQTLPPFIERLLSLYGAYIHEIVVVNDNSVDETAEVTETLAKSDSRIRLINRSMPNGVGRALKDGYQAATGRYIFSMDCDFIEILPELRGLFDAVADGREGAIGSRFSHDSILINYPFLKLLFNRTCHALIKLFLLEGVRDVTNNLKLYRADILKNLNIESTHFAANLETGLKPLLAGHDIAEIPISWINRTFEMGTSSFNVRKVGLDYARVLFRCWRMRDVPHRGLLSLTFRPRRPRAVAMRNV